MTIHGNQLLLPLFLRRPTSLPPITQNEELALNFHLLTKNLGERHKILSFSRLLWPFESLPGTLSKHIILDGLLLFKNQGTYSNPPRQPLIGHILRNVEELSKIEVMNKVIEVFKYTDIGAKEIGKEEESEFHELKIDGLVSPGFLNSLLVLLPQLTYKKIIDYMPLEAALSTENALQIADQYHQTIETMRGNSLRWKTQIELVSKEVDKWLLDLNVNLKDIEARYSSQISKTSSIINDSQVSKKVKLEKDRIDVWNNSAKKRIITNLSLVFKTFELGLEDIIKKNKMYSSSNVLTRKTFMELKSTISNYISYLREAIGESVEYINTIEKKFNESKVLAEEIDNKAKEKLQEYEGSLNLQLSDRDNQLAQFKEEKQNQILNLRESKNVLEQLFSEIKQIIQIKVNTCLKEATELENCSIDDDKSELFKKPIQWIYMPLYAMFIEDEEEFEEYMDVILPGYIRNDPSKIYETENEIYKLKKLLKERIEDDMAIRSNFEFSCENKNLLEESSFSRDIQQGLKSLREKGYINTEIEESTIISLNRL